MVSLTVIIVLISYSILTLALDATAWVQCDDLSQFECRNITVPRFYESNPVVAQGDPNGGLRILERRYVVGTPKRHVWLLQGGSVSLCLIICVTLIVSSVRRALLALWEPTLPSA